MKPFLLVDLYVPATCASVGEAVDAAHGRGLGAIVYVASEPGHLPSADALSSAQTGQGVTVHPAYEVTGSGSRVLAILPSWDDTAQYAALEDLDDTAEVIAEVHAAGGAAILVCPHAEMDGSPRRGAPALNGTGTVPGVLCMVSHGRRLVRDLDCEHTSAHGRPVLGGTGPFGGLDDLGRFSTLFSRHTASRLALIDGLRAGHGATVEMTRPGAEPPEPSGPPKKKRRRRRRRGKGRSSTGGAEPTSTD